MYIPFLDEDSWNNFRRLVLYIDKHVTQFARNRFKTVPKPTQLYRHIGKLHVVSLCACRLTGFLFEEEPLSFLYTVINIMSTKTLD